MMEAAYYHLPSPSDSERLRPYLQRQPISTPQHFPQVSFKLLILIINQCQPLIDISNTSLSLNQSSINRLNFHIRIQLISFNVSQRKRFSLCFITWKVRRLNIWPRKLSKSKAGDFTRSTWCGSKGMKSRRSSTRSLSRWVHLHQLLVISQQTNGKFIYFFFFSSFFRVKIDRTI